MTTKKKRKTVVKESRFMSGLYFVQRKDKSVVYTLINGGAWVVDEDPMSPSYKAVSAKTKKKVLSYVDILGKTWETV